MSETTSQGKTVTERDEAYFDVFVTALEGGIGYWSQCTDYRWTRDGEGRLACRPHIRQSPPEGGGIG